MIATKVKGAWNQEKGERKVVLFMGLQFQIRNKKNKK